MQHDSTPQTAEAEIPKYLQCEPRTYKVTFDKWNDVCELDFTIVIKCTDEELHEHNNFWSNANYRLSENNGDIVAVILKMIGKNVFYSCYEGTYQVSTPPYKYGINTIFQNEGWNDKCFEITNLNFEDYVDGDDFEFELVKPEGANSWVIFSVNVVV